MMAFSLYFLILARFLKACSIFQVVTPTGNVLVEDLTLRVESGSNLLITGRFCWLILSFSYFARYLYQPACSSSIWLICKCNYPDGKDKNSMFLR